MRIRYTDTALADLGDLLSYLIERNPRAAATVGKAIEATAARIAIFQNRRRRQIAHGAHGACWPISVFDLL